MFRSLIPRVRRAGLRFEPWSRHPEPLNLFSRCVLSRKTLYLRTQCASSLLFRNVSHTNGTEQQKNLYEHGDTPQEKQKDANNLTPPTKLPTWLTFLIAVIFMICTVAFLLNMWRRLQQGMPEEVSKSEHNLFMIEGDTESIFHLMNEENMDKIYSNESTIAVLFRIIKVTARTIQLIFIFIPVTISYVLQHFLFPSYYDMWCTLLVRTLEFAGPCFIKLGQWMATRPDLFSNHLCYRLSRLHTQAPMHHFADTRLMIEKSFNKPLEELFDDIDQHPLASGAIAQIHKAKLRDREGYVAVKVRHPRVSESIFRDLTIIFTFSQLIGKVGGFPWLNLRENVLNFAMNMHAQTNMDLEAQALEQFAKNFRYIPSIIFPTPIMHSKSVLIESFEEGIPIIEYISDKYPQELRTRIATLGTSMYLKMMFIDNLVHADLHPGNILVRLDQNSNPKLVILDTGMMTILSTEDRKNFIDLFSAIIAGNSEEAANLMIERGKSGDLIKTDPEKVANFKCEMAQLIEYVMDRPLADLEVGRILQRALSIGRKYHVILEPNFTTLVIGTIIIEGLGRRLNPDFNFIEAAKPYLSHERAVRKAYSTRHMKRINIDKITNWFPWK